MEKNQNNNPKNQLGFKIRINESSGYGKDYTNKDIDQLLNLLEITNEAGYLFPCSGIFFSMPGSSILEWTVKEENIALKNLPEIDPRPNMWFKSKVFSEFKVRKIIVMSGKTECDETCIFFGSCDGERGSFFNPSTRLFPCDEYDLNKNTIRKNIITLDGTGKI